MSQGSLFFNNYLTNDQSSKYWVYFYDLSGHSFGTTDALVVNDADGNPISGYISGRSQIDFIFDYTGNTQGGRVVNTDTNIIAVSIGSSLGRYVSTGSTLTSGGTSTMVLSTDRDWIFLNDGSYVGAMQYWDGTQWTGTTSGITWQDDLGRLDIHTLQFDTTEFADVTTVGGMHWNYDESTLDMHLSDNVSLQLGQEIHMKVKNMSGSDILDGTLVMFAGVLGASGRILVTPAVSDGTYPNKYIIGLATETIANGEDGFISTYGKIRGINTTGQTEAWNNGDILYSNPTNPGGLTNIEPTAPALKGAIAAVIYADDNNGVLFVRPTFNPVLHEVNDVQISGATTGDTLKFTGTIWENVPDLDELIIAASDEISNLTSGTAKATFRMPWAMTVTEVRASVTTAPSGSTIIVDINDGGTSILSTKISIDSEEKTSKTATTQPVISDNYLADDTEITIDIDQIGSIVAGTGLKVTIIGKKT